MHLPTRQGLEPRRGWKYGAGGGGGEGGISPICGSIDHRPLRDRCQKKEKKKKERRREEEQIKEKDEKREGGTKRN